jgi:hypothetical protein
MVGMVEDFEVGVLPRYGLYSRYKIIFADICVISGFCVVFWKKRQNSERGREVDCVQRQSDFSDFFWPRSDLIAV